LAQIYSLKWFIALHLNGSNTHSFFIVLDSTELIVTSYSKLKKSVKDIFSQFFRWHYLLQAIPKNEQLNGFVELKNSTMY